MVAVVKAQVEELNQEKTESGAELGEAEFGEARLGPGLDWADHVGDAVKGGGGDGCLTCYVLVTIHYIVRV